MTEQMVRDTVPESGHDILADMLSEQTSLKTKAWAARLLTEQMVSVFLYESTNSEGCRKPSLGDMIDGIKESCGNDVLSAIRQIKLIGDKASHYSKDNAVSQQDVERIVPLTLKLFALILAEKCTNLNLLRRDNYSLYIFSTLYPSVREEVLFSLIDFDGAFDDIEKLTLLENYGVAAAKAGRRKKARRQLDKLLNRGQISQYFHSEIAESMHLLEGQRAYLPTAKDIASCRHNFEAVLSTLTDSQKNENSQLIDIIKRLLY